MTILGDMSPYRLPIEAEFAGDPSLGPATPEKR
jgi:hypothetical protein